LQVKNLNPVPNTRVSDGGKIEKPEKIHPISKSTPSTENKTTTKKLKDYEEALSCTQAKNENEIASKTIEEFDVSQDFCSCQKVMRTVLIQL
jgi:hypothetical protein